MSRGGYHPHAERWGRKSAWLNASVTKTIRVPEALAEQILDLAHRLDAGEVIASETEPNKLESDPNEGAETTSNNAHELTEALQFEIQQLREHLLNVTRERNELVELNDALTAELVRAKQTTQQPDLEAIRERILAGLRLGKQAPNYKRVKAVLDQFIGELR